MKQLTLLTVLSHIESFESYTVIRIIDGDTIEVSGLDAPIRLIGINTPEKGEPGFDDATNFLKDLILDKKVYVAFEIKNGERSQDVFKRYLCYIYIYEEDCYKMVNLEIFFSENGEKYFKYAFDLQAFFKKSKDEIYEVLCSLDHSADVVHKRKLLKSTWASYKIERLSP